MHGYFCPLSASFMALTFWRKQPRNADTCSSSHLYAASCGDLASACAWRASRSIRTWKASVRHGSERERGLVWAGVRQRQCLARVQQVLWGLWYLVPRRGEARLLVWLTYLKFLEVVELLSTRLIPVLNLLLQLAKNSNRFRICIAVSSRGRRGRARAVHVGVSLGLWTKIHLNAQRKRHKMLSRVEGEGRARDTGVFSSTHTHTHVDTRTHPQPVYFLGSLAVGAFALKYIKKSFFFCKKLAHLYASPPTEVWLIAQYERRVNLREVLARPGFSCRLWFFKLSRQSSTSSAYCPYFYPA